MDLFACLDISEILFPRLFYAMVTIGWIMFHGKPWALRISLGSECTDEVQ